MPDIREKAQHIVVLMMENRSFDHMLGGLKAAIPAVDGLTGTETNPDTKGAPVQVTPPPITRTIFRTIPAITTRTSTFSSSTAHPAARPECRDLCMPTSIRPAT